MASKLLVVVIVAVALRCGSATRYGDDCPFLEGWLWDLGPRGLLVAVLDQVHRGPL